MNREMHVAVAVISNERSQVLISQRRADAHQGGLWEFPGGKVEQGEDIRAALSRELEEELGISLAQARPLIRIRHDYPEQSVVLDVWRVIDFAGHAIGREGQAIAWVAPENLAHYHFPAANLPIVAAARLPARYLITPEPVGAVAPFLASLDAALHQGIRLVQLRAKTLGDGDYRALAEQAIRLCRARGATLLLNAAPELVMELNADGVHLTAERLMSLAQRPLVKDKWVGASCHNARELGHACRIGVDFVVVSPVRVTASHPQAMPLGWDGLYGLTEQAGAPVYALGGMDESMLNQAWDHGAQGIAGIRAWWK